jgi:Mg2+/Co2+ transporter CorB
VLRLHEQKARVLGAILLGNNLVNIMASALATSLLLDMFGDHGVVYATLVMTVLILIFSEVLPKTYALCNPDHMALVIAPIMRVVTMAFGPITHIVQIIVKLTLSLFGIRLASERREEEQEEELRGAIELHEGKAPDIIQEQRMLRSILDLDDVEVDEIMTHRSNVEMIDLDDDVEQNIDQILDSPFTRIPIYRDDSDNILGLIHAKELLRALRKVGNDIKDIDLETLATPPWFIPDTTSLLDQLTVFRQRRSHFAVVIDEYGAFQGIVTLEDILEEIVGEIDDEHDITQPGQSGIDSIPGVIQQSDGRYVIEGSVTIRDLNRLLDWNLPDDDATTIAGLVLHEARLIPQAGQIFTFHDFRFEVLAREGNRLTSLRLTAPVKTQ